ncbi:MAG: cytochrome c oxidase subunit II [Candidatus Heimdallarchaeota archaeon]
MRKFVFITVSFLCFMLLTQIGAISAHHPESDRPPVKEDIQGIFMLTFVLGLLVAGIAFGLLLFVLIKFRESNKQPPKEIKNPLRLELSWTAFAIIIVGILLVASLPVAHEIVSGPTADYEVIEIHGFRFGWRFTYENGTTTFSVDPTLDVHLIVEVHKEYLLNITSDDVIHSFFVYDLAFKVDAIPGEFTEFVLVIDEPGNYQVQCAEFCGDFHYDMSAVIRAVDLGGSL